MTTLREMAGICVGELVELRNILDDAARVLRDSATGQVNEDGTVVLRGVQCFLHLDPAERTYWGIDSETNQVDREVFLQAVEDDIAANTSNLRDMVGRVGLLAGPWELCAEPFVTDVRREGGRVVDHTLQAISMLYQAATDRMGHCRAVADTLKCLEGAGLLRDGLTIADFEDALERKQEAAPAGTKRLAMRILGLLRSEPDRQWTQLQLAVKLQDDPAVLVSGNPPRVKKGRSAISRAVRWLRGIGHPIPRRRYMYVTRRGQQCADG